MMVIGPGRVNFSLRVVWRARGARLVSMDAAFQRERGDHLRHHRLVAVFADAHLDLVREVDPVDLFQEAMNEVLTRLFALGDDVDPRRFLQLDREQRGVALGPRQFIAF